VRKFLLSTPEKLIRNLVRRRKLLLLKLLAGIAEANIGHTSVKLLPKMGEVLVLKRVLIMFLPLCGRMQKSGGLLLRFPTFLKI
jgi:hypothetical protein